VTVSPSSASKAHRSTDIRDSAAQRIALPSRAVEELEQVVHGGRVGRAERSRTDAAAKVEGHRGADGTDACIGRGRWVFASRPTRVTNPVCVKELFASAQQRRLNRGRRVVFRVRE